MRLECPRSFICVMALALLAQTFATADEPKPDDPSPEQILDRMAKAYADCKSYRDSGIVTTVFVEDAGKRTVEKPFTTAFVRPDMFRFEFKDANGRYLISSNGQDVQTWWDVQTGNSETEVTATSRGRSHWGFGRVSRSNSCHAHAGQTQGLGWRTHQQCQAD